LYNCAKMCTGHVAAVPGESLLSIFSMHATLTSQRKTGQTDGRPSDHCFTTYPTYSQHSDISCLVVTKL